MKCKFNVGDKVIGTSDMYVFTNKGWIGEVTAVFEESNTFNAKGKAALGLECEFKHLRPEHFDLYEARKEECKVEYKVGDRVIVESSNIDRYNKDGKCKYENEVGIIECIDTEYEYPYCVIGTTYHGGLWCRVKGLAPTKTEHATNEKIVITVEGKKTLARLYKDGKVVKSAEARCCPEDTFDFKVGANLAYNRLMGVPTGEEKKEEPKPVKKVQSDKFKRGDKVVVRKNTCSHFAKIGDVIILKEIWDKGLGLEKRVMWNYTHEDTVDGRDSFGYIVEEDIELYDTLKLTKEDIKKMKNGMKVWCSDLYDGQEHFDTADCGWHTIKHISPVSTVLVDEKGDYYDIDNMGDRMGYNAYLTEQKVK